MNPSAVNGGNNALGPKNGAVAAAVQRSQGCIDFLIGKLAGSFCAPGGKYLVGVVVMFMMMFMFMAVLMMMCMLVVMVVMFVLVVVVMVVRVVMTTAVWIVAFLVVVPFLGHQLRHHIMFVGFHGLQDLFSGDLIPGVVMMIASPLCARSSATVAAIFSSLMF